MQGFFRSLALSVLLAAGCGDTTFDLLQPSTASSSSPGGDTALGAAGDMTLGSGGNHGGTGGSTNVGNAGTGDGPFGVGGACGPGGCQPVYGCGPYGGNCIECSMDVDCPDATPYCGRGRCVECLTYAECPPGRACGCQSDQFCDTGWNICVSWCKDARDCTMERPLCDTYRNACIECSANDYCAFNPHGHVCYKPLGSCVECEDSKDCPDPDAPVCNTADFSCHQCVKDTDCGFARLCKDGRCTSPPPPPPEP